MTAKEVLERHVEMEKNLIMFMSHVKKMFPHVKHIAQEFSRRSAVRSGKIIKLLQKKFKILDKDGFIIF
jgi:hypothetical protein